MLSKKSNLKQRVPVRLWSDALYFERKLATSFAGETSQQPDTENGNIC
jgi:hypothetical protein